MGILRKLREWREGADGTLKGPALKTESLVNDYHFAGSFDGSDPDERLNTALNSVTTDDTLYLEKAEYQGDYTISTDGLLLVGTGGGANLNDTAFDNGVDIEAAGVEIRNVDFRGRDGTIFAPQVLITHCSRVNHTIESDECAVVSSMRSDVTFSSDTENGLAGLLWAESSVTDNGNNTLGNIT